MSKIYIYTLSDPVTSLIRYVGKTNGTLNDRLCKHIYQAKNRNCHSANWIISLLKSNQKPIIEEIEICEKDNWQESEIYWIAQLKEWGFELTNHTIGGEAGSGKKSVEHRNKIRLANLGKKQSIETKIKRSISLTGQKRTPEQRENISKSVKGKPRPYLIGNKHRKKSIKN